MTDSEFIRALERCEFPDTDFNHAAHVRAAYLSTRPSPSRSALSQIR